MPLPTLLGIIFQFGLFDYCPYTRRYHFSQPVPFDDSM